MVMPTIVNAKTKNIRGVESSMPTLMDGEIGLPTDKARIWKGTSASGNQIVSDYDLTLQNTANIAKLSNKNYIINPNFDIWQRGTSFLNILNWKYTADRYIITNNITGTPPSNITHSKISLINGEVPHALSAYRVSVDGSGILNSNDIYQVSQLIENGTSKLCGVNNKITLSFYARSSITNKKLGVCLTQNYGSGGTPSTSEVVNGRFFTLTNSWQKCNYTFQPTTLNGKSFGTNNDDFLKLTFAYAYGISSANVVGDTIGETFGGTGTIDIAQIKLEIGDMVTPFEPRTFDEELNLCQRYYETMQYSVVSPTTATGQTIRATYNFKNIKRNIPTITLTEGYKNGFGTVSIGYYGNTAFSVQSTSNAVGVGEEFTGVANIDGEIY